jgi:hypothetical protein
MGGLHGGGVRQTYDDAIGSGLDVFDRAIAWQEMVGASGIGYCGGDGILHVICLGAK